jgi:hypothetical protein
VKGKGALSARFNQSFSNLASAWEVEFERINIESKTLNS